MMLNFKQILSLLLFTVFTTSVVNAHALSHLFESDTSSVEQCNTCDEYVLNTQKDVTFITPHLQEFSFLIVEIKLESSVSFDLTSPIVSPRSGKYFNKPPPFKLV